MKKLEGMRAKVKSELAHIPRGDYCQNILRAYYFSIRMHSLGKNSTLEDNKNVVLDEAIKLARQFANENRLHFEPRFDIAFFGLEKNSSKMRPSYIG